MFLRSERFCAAIIAFHDKIPVKNNVGRERRHFFRVFSLFSVLFSRTNKPPSLEKVVKKTNRCVACKMDLIGLFFFSTFVSDLNSENKNYWIQKLLCEIFFFLCFQFLLNLFSIHLFSGGKTDFFVVNLLTHFFSWRFCLKRMIIFFFPLQSSGTRYLLYDVPGWCWLLVVWYGTMHIHINIYFVCDTSEIIREASQGFIQDPSILLLFPAYTRDNLQQPANPRQLQHASKQQLQQCSRRSIIPVYACALH